MCDPATMMMIGSAVSIGGSIYQGIAGYQQGQAQARMLNEQAATEAQLTGVEDARLRDEMRGQIAKQRLQIVGRGVSLDSPSAVLLGQQAAEELSYASQSVRSQGEARQQELKAGATSARASGTLALLKGGFSAAGTFLNDQPTVWPGLFGEAGAT